ncbi:hypothetical protein DUHN55_22620 [Helicobacter pylori]
MSHSVGRHRAPERYNPLAEIGTVISQTGTPLAKGSAVLAASGGLVAAIAIPAQAAPAVEQADATPAAAAPAAAAVTAPSTTATAKATSADFGQIEVEPVAKPTGPTPYQLRMRAEREEARQEAAAERQREQEQAAEARRAEQAREAQEEQRSEEAAASRSQERQAPATTPAPASTPEPTQAPSAPAPTSGGVIAIAKQYIGTPYVYGGSTPAGFDCSGFTQYVFAKAGKSIPRVTTAQQATATPVSSPQPGDLVFFGSPSWHVGIYVGDGMMIDSPRTGSTVSIRPVFDGVSGYGRV